MQTTQYTPNRNAPVKDALRNRLAVSIVGITLSGTTGLTLAASAEGQFALEEVVVTAQRKSESLQDSALSVAAATEQELTSRVMTDIGELSALSPGVSIGQQYGQNRTFIRGIGLTSFSLGADASTAFHVDGVYVGRPAAQLSSFYDLQRIEVVRGPQGTLYGRNATAGSINLITNNPTDTLSGYLNLEAGNYSRRSAEGAISGPFNEEGTLLGRLAFRTVEREGYGRNELTGRDIDDESTQSARIKLRYLASDQLTIELSAHYHKEDDSNYAAHLLGAFRDDTPLTGVLFGGSTPSKVRNINSDVEVINDREDQGMSLTINWEGDQFSLKSITGYRDFERYNRHDIDGTSADAGGGTHWTESSEQLSQEFQLNIDRERYSGVMGLYFYEEEVEGRTFLDLSPLAFPGATFDENGTVDTSAWALFAEFSFALSERLELVAGARYSSEERESDGVFSIFGSNIPTSGKEKWTATTPKLGLNYTTDSGALLYFSATKGFKSGLFNVGSLNPAIDPEYIWAYEIGAKSNFFNDRVQLSASGFYYDYEDLQVGRVENNQLVTVNAASAENKGIELAVRALLTPNLEVYADLSVLSAKFDEFITADVNRPELGNLDLSGNYLPNAPKKSANYGIIYNTSLADAGSLQIRLDGTWSDKVYFTEFNVDSMSQASVSKLNASVTYESPRGDWRVTAYGKNLTDKTSVSNSIIASSLFGLSQIGYLTPPRTYGIRVGYHW